MPGDFAHQIVACALRRWSPGIGDPSVMGWVTVAAYLLAAALALRVAARGAMPPATARRERAFWGLLGLGLLVLAVNKQLDLQSFLTATGRCVAQNQGWYEARRTVQLDFVLALAAVSALLGLTMLWALRRSLRRTGLAVLGAVGVIGFVLIRAVGFHHVDALIDLRLHSVRMNWVLELWGLAAIALAALLHPVRDRRRTAPG